MKAPMVLAILSGEKTVTRRIPRGVKPYANAGDRLWVKETWGLHDTEPKDGPENARVYYRATDGDRHDLRYQKWRPSLFMPKWVARIHLEVVEVVREPLKNIDNIGAMEEGTPDIRNLQNGWDLRDCFAHLWDSIHGKTEHSWWHNPTVDVVRFKVVSMPKIGKERV